MKLRAHLAANPVIVKELRSRMRGARAFAVLTGVLLLLGSVSFGLYRIVLTTAAYGGLPLSPQIGQALFAGLALLELIMICFVTPALTASAISGEREMQTYEMLLATPLNPASILRGKLFSALSYVFLLIFAAVPLCSLVFTFGGVSPRDMLKTLVILVVIAVTLGVLGIFMSTWLRHSSRATVLTYLLVLTLLIGPYLVYILVGVLRNAQPPSWILIPNPVSALFSALTPSTQDMGSFGYSGLLGSLSMLLTGRIDPGAASSGGMGWPRPLYHYTLPFYIGLSLALYLLATRLVRPVRRWRIGRREALGAMALVLLFSGGVALAFLASASRYEWRAGVAGPAAMPTPALAPLPPMPVAAKQVIAVAPQPTDPGSLSPIPTPTRNVILPAEDETAIYAAVVRQLYTEDHTFGDRPPNWAMVCLVRWTDDSVGDPEAPRTEPRLLSTPTQEGIVASLADLPAEFRWVDGKDEVLLEKNGGQVQEDAAIKNGGAILDSAAIITMGNLYLQDDGSVYVSASLYFGSLGATGKTYMLQQVGGVWQVVGTVGAEWIS
jgi:ABC-2 type transport system permease protein